MTLAFRADDGGTPRVRRRARAQSSPCAAPNFHAYPRRVTARGYVGGRPVLGSVSAITHLAEADVGLALLMAKSRHTWLRSLQRYARPGTAAVAKLVAETIRSVGGGELLTQDARVLQFPPSATARPQDYGQFSRELSADELAGCCCSSDDDQRQIARHRREVNCLGFAVQLGTVRYLGRFLENPADAPRTWWPGPRARSVSRRALT